MDVKRLEEYELLKVIGGKEVVDQGDILYESDDITKKPWFYPVVGGSGFVVLLALAYAAYKSNRGVKKVKDEDIKDYIIELKRMANDINTEKFDDFINSLISKNGGGNFFNEVKKQLSETYSEGDMAYVTKLLTYNIVRETLGLSWTYTEKQPRTTNLRIKELLTINDIRYNAQYVKTIQKAMGKQIAKDLGIDLKELQRFGDTKVNMVFNIGGDNTYTVQFSRGEILHSIGGGLFNYHFNGENMHDTKLNKHPTVL